MDVIYFVHGFLFGVWKILSGLFDICVLHGEVAEENETWITELDYDYVDEEIEKKMDVE